MYSFDGCETLYRRKVTDKYSNLHPFNPIQIHQKAKNPPDLNPCSSLIISARKWKL